MSLTLRFFVWFFVFSLCFLYVQYMYIKIHSFNIQQMLVDLPTWEFFNEEITKKYENQWEVKVSKQMSLKKVASFPKRQYIFQKLHSSNQLGNKVPSFLKFPSQNIHFSISFVHFVCFTLWVLPQLTQNDSNVT